MTAKELRSKYLQFFKERGHAVLPNLPLVPENDPTTLFISAGMQPLTPYLLGEPHPQGARLVSLQRCLRTTDIDEVGDTTHLSFFEMLGNWSLGDYFKKEALSWSLEFVTKVLGLPQEKLSVTIFAGDENAPFDAESERVWLGLGIPKERIFALPRADNWWEGGGEEAPGGPDSEIFVATGKEPCGTNCRPGDGCGRFFEIWNNVFMEFRKKKSGGYEPLPQKNVDTGLGLERTLTVLQGKKDNYQTELFAPIIRELEEIFNVNYRTENHQKPLRVITDHLRAATFLVADGVLPGNSEQGYVLRRLIRRAVRFARLLGEKGHFSSQTAAAVIRNYQESYPFLLEKREEILFELEKEEEAFGKTLTRGLKEFAKMVKALPKQQKTLRGQDAFFLYETYGFPVEQTVELAQEQGILVDLAGFRQAQEKHQERSRQASPFRFTGGLADHSQESIRLHTATHLLHQALRDVLGKHVRQKGSNITSRRLRFDFSHPQKLTPEQIQKIEAVVNEKIAQGLPVNASRMSLAKAKKIGALAFFGEKYADAVTVYTIGSTANPTQAYSKEVCAGPHVKNTSELGRFRIVKEESVGRGTRRIKAVLEK